jgi:Competence protein
MNGCLTGKRQGPRDVSPIFRGLRKGWSLIAGAGMTTLVAGTAPFALYHFHRMTHYGLFANLVAAPLVGLPDHAHGAAESDRHAFRS